MFQYLTPPLSNTVDYTMLIEIISAVHTEYKVYKVEQ